MLNIVHIAAHLGAGAGKAISGLALADKVCRHAIIILQSPEKTDHIEKCLASGIEVLVCPDEVAFQRKIADADVVVVDWWHHPSVYEKLIRMDNADARIVLWSHVNGLHYPIHDIRFLKAFDACLFTSRASFENPNWSEEEWEEVKKFSRLVYGIGDFTPYAFRMKEDYCLHDEIRVGYVGSLDYAKIHPDFVEWIKRAAAINSRIHFYVVGDRNDKLSSDVQRAGLVERVSFLGFRNDIPELLRSFDLFMYPLNPYNFATTENAILEAMATGLPVMTTDGIVEKTIIHDGENGILVSDAEKFSEKLTRLILNEKERVRLGRTAREYVEQTYDRKSNLAAFHDSINAVMTREKSMHSFSKYIGESPFLWFLSACGKREKEVFKKAVSLDEQAVHEARHMEQIYMGQSKGSVRQFQSLYPGDEKLGTLVDIMANA